MRRNRFVLAGDARPASPPLQRPRGLKKREAPPRPEWRLESSMWRRRPARADSASFYDTEEVMRRALACDWARAGKERGLFSYIRRKEEAFEAGESEGSTPASPREGGGEGGGEGKGSGEGKGGGEGEGEGEGEGGGEGEGEGEGGGEGEAGRMGAAEAAAEVIDPLDEAALARRAAEEAERAAAAEAARALEAGELGEEGEVLGAMAEHVQLVPRRARAPHPHPHPSP